MQKVFGIWYLKYQIPSLQKYLEKYLTQINMYVVFYLNTSFEYLTQHWPNMKSISNEPTV